MRPVSRVVCLVAVALLLASVPSWAADWKQLGQKVVDYRTNPAVVEVAAGVGPVAKLKFGVTQANLEIGAVKVTFADGETADLVLNKFIGKGGSRTLDLPSAKEVKSIEFAYRGISAGEGLRVAIVTIQGSV